MISLKWITDTVSSSVDLARVDVREEVERVLDEAELGVVALDLALGQLAHRLDVDLVDDRREDALARARGGGPR